MYTIVNDLFYEKNRDISLPYNIWFTRPFPFVDRKWCLAGVKNVLDIPLEDGRVALSPVTNWVGPSPQNYLRCCMIQGTLIKFLSKSTAGTHLPNPALVS